MQPRRRRLLYVVAGTLASVLWLAEDAMTVIPGRGELTHWIVGNALAFLAGAAFGAAAATRS